MNAPVPIPTKVCAQCGNTFPKRPTTAAKKWARSRFCTNACAGAFMKGKLKPSLRGPRRRGQRDVTKLPNAPRREQPAPRAHTGAIAYARILELNAVGMRLTHIAAELRIPYSAVSAVLDRGRQA